MKVDLRPKVVARAMSGEVLLVFVSLAAVISKFYNLKFRYAFVFFKSPANNK